MVLLRLRHIGVIETPNNILLGFMIRIMPVFIYLLFTQPVYSDTTTHVFAGYITLDTFHQMGNADKENWVKGAIDGIIIMSLNESVSEAKELGDCIRDFEVSSIIK